MWYSFSVTFFEPTTPKLGKNMHFRVRYRKRSFNLLSSVMNREKKNLEWGGCCRFRQYSLDDTAHAREADNGTLWSSLVSTRLLLSLDCVSRASPLHSTEENANINTYGDSERKVCILRGMFKGTVLKLTWKNWEKTRQISWLGVLKPRRVLIHFNYKSDELPKCKV